MTKRDEIIQEISKTIKKIDSLNQKIEVNLTLSQEIPSNILKKVEKSIQSIIKNYNNEEIQELKDQKLALETKLAETFKS